MFNVLVPAVAVFLFLASIGISKPRKMKLSTWCWIYIVIAVMFDFFTVLAILLQNSQLIEILLGVAAGSATSLAYHVWKDMREIGHEH
jgi:presenilin-like A22 family membrane protease